MRLSALFVALVVAAGCGGFPEPADVNGIATRLEITSGNGQTLAAASVLTAPIVVTAFDAKGAVVKGAMVTFNVTAGGGSVSDPMVTTDKDGRAQTDWTLGPMIGQNGLEVSAPGVASVFFTATGVLGPPSKLVLTSGNDQSAVVNTALPLPLVATVTDMGGNPITAFPVTFTVTGGGGNVSTTTGMSDVLGQARTSLTLGTIAGANTVDAQGVGLTGPAVSFSATGLPAAPNKVIVVSGDGQRFVAGMALAPFIVTTADTYGNATPTAGTNVTFNMTAGDGSLSSTTVPTDAQGQAQATLTTGTAIVHTVSAQGSGFTGAAVAFNAAPLAFATKTDFDASSSAPSVATGDLNGDGKVDVAAAIGGGSVVAVYRNTTATNATTPTFDAEVDFTVASNPWGIALADLNGDGKLDIAVCNHGSTSASVLLNTTATGASTLTFSTKVDFTVGSQPYGITIADLNGDAKGDLVVANKSSQTVSVLLNTTATGATTPTFASKVDFTPKPGYYAMNVAAIDVNTDGKPDLAVSHYSTGYLSVLLNTTASGATTPTFATATNFTTGSYGHGIAVLDVNADGKPDLAVANKGANNVSVLLNTTATGASTATFATKTDFATGMYAVSVATSDINGDGRPDLAVSNKYSSTSTVSIFLNTTAKNASTATFATKLDLTAASEPRGLALGDFNGDGRPDVVTGNKSATNISVLLAQ